MKTIPLAILLAATLPGLSEVPGPIKSRLAGLLPASESRGQPRFYSSDLYQYINGGAEAFHNYDMVAMVHQEYRVQEVELTVDIYDMGNLLNAFGVYSSERSPSSRFLPIGTEAHGSALALNFWQGQYYVKLGAFGPEGKTTPVMDSSARAISQRIGSERPLPGFLRMLPEKNRIPHSELYVKKAPLGHAVLSPAYTAKYGMAGKETTLVLSEAASPDEARVRIERLRKHFSETGKVVPVQYGFRGVNQLEGQWLCFSRQRYAVILMNPPLYPASLLKELFAKIP